MLDPREGVDPDGMIRTGVDRGRVPAAFRPVVDALVNEVERAAAGPVSLFLYGSVATGAARTPGSDVDALTVGLPAAQAAAVGARLTERFAAVCRGVEVAAAQPDDVLGDGDEAYGNRLFLHHYCVLLAGPDPRRGWGPFPADVRAARALNGDIAGLAARWRAELGSWGTADVEPAARSGRRVARKTLLAVAGLVSVQEGGWTTDREGAAHRWARSHPVDEAGLAELLSWSDSRAAATPEDLRRVLGTGPGGVVGRVVEAFSRDIGTWRGADESRRPPGSGP